MTRGRSGRSARAPGGLSVDFLDLGGPGGDEVAILSWDVPRAEVAAGLTAAERDVLERVVGGASNAAIARARGTSARTVANQVAALLGKLGAASRFDLIRRFGGSRGKARRR